MVKTMFIDIIIENLEKNKILRDLNLHKHNEGTHNILKVHL